MFDQLLLQGALSCGITFYQLVHTMVVEIEAHSPHTSQSLGESSQAASLAGNVTQPLSSTSGHIQSENQRATRPTTRTGEDSAFWPHDQNNIDPAAVVTPPPAATPAMPADAPAASVSTDATVLTTTTAGRFRQLKVTSPSTAQTATMPPSVAPLVCLHTRLRDHCLALPDNAVAII